MANETWLEWFPNNDLRHLDFYHSDHRALFLCLEDSSGLPTNNNKKRSRFRFENMWIREPECNDIVASNWMTTSQSALLSTIDNISTCAKNLASWNQSKFGSLARDIKETQRHIIHLHNIQDRLDYS